MLFLNKKIFLQTLFFVSGFSIMVFELLGSRILAPYVGNSLVTWTSIIGIVLLFLSFGYYIGGIFSDKKYLWSIFFATSFSFLLLFLFKDMVLVHIYSIPTLSLNFKIILMSILLFGPSSFLFALASPFLVKDVIRSEKKIGKDIGNIYSISTIGSIVGTFITGFYLIPNLGIQNILLILSGVYLLISFYFIKKIKFVFFFYLLFIFFLLLFSPQKIDNTNIFHKETPYGVLSIKDLTVNNREIRRLYIDNLVHSEMFLGSSELTSAYAHYYEIPNFLNIDLKKVLMIGGGAYSYPKYFVKNYPDNIIDVVEINPEITKIAKNYFNLEDSDNLNIYHQDGRVFLNNSTEKYDAVLIDAFNGFSIPYHLTTVEFLESIDNHLTDNGIIVVNIPGLLEGDGSDFIYSQYKTYKEVFPEVDIFLAQDKDKRELFQNIILIARKEKGNFPKLESEEYKLLLDNMVFIHNKKEGLLLTDDFAPVNFMTKSFHKFS